MLLSLKKDNGSKNGSYLFTARKGLEALAKKEILTRSPSRDYIWRL
jgi:hypothetical protein